MCHIWRQRAIGIVCSLYQRRCRAWRIVGTLLPASSNLLGAINPGTYALIGAASLLGGVTRMTISIVVIIIETTNNSTYAIPIMASIMSAKLMGDYFNEGIYDMHIRHQNIRFMHPEYSANKNMQAGDIMVKDPVSFELQARVGDIVDELLRNGHNGFPVVYPVEEDITKFEKNIRTKGGSFAFVK